MAVGERLEDHDVYADAEYLLVMTRNKTIAAGMLARRVQIPIEEAREIISGVEKEWERKASDPVKIEHIRQEHQAFLKMVRHAAFERGQLRTSLDADLWLARFDGLDVSREVKVSGAIEHRHGIDLSQLPDEVLRDEAINVGLRRALLRNEDEDVIDAEIVEDES